MNCADVEILLAEYVDGTLHEEAKSTVENHLISCAACRELAHDASSAVAFMERAADVPAPPELVTRILYEVSNGPSHAVVKPPLARRWFGPTLGSWLEPVLQPRWVMGMATTVLFMGMLMPHARQLSPSDLDPVKVWVGAENRVSRAWERGVKYYESIRLVFEIQTRLKEWTEEAANNAAARNAQGQVPQGQVPQGQANDAPQGERK